MENKLKEALKKLGIETAEQLNAAIKAEKPLDIGIMTVSNTHLTLPTN